MNPDVKRKIRAYRESEEGIGKVCPTCQCTIPVKRFKAHVYYCYFCEKCQLFKTNRTQHDALCKPDQQVSKKGCTPCPYCSGKWYCNLLRHLENVHNFNQEVIAMFRKNVLKKNRPAKDRQLTRVNATKTKNKVKKKAIAKISSSKSKSTKKRLQISTRRKRKTFDGSTSIKVCEPASPPRGKKLVEDSPEEDELQSVHHEIEIKVEMNEDDVHFFVKEEPFDDVEPHQRCPYPHFERSPIKKLAKVEAQTKTWTPKSESPRQVVIISFRRKNLEVMEPETRDGPFSIKVEEKRDDDLQYWQNACT